jgi:hypothetical protein
LCVSLIELIAAAGGNMAEEENKFACMVTPAIMEILERDGLRALKTAKKASTHFPMFCPVGNKLKKVANAPKKTTDRCLVEYQYSCCPGCILVCHWERKNPDPRHQYLEFSMKCCTHITYDFWTGSATTISVGEASWRMPYAVPAVVQAGNIPEPMDVAVGGEVEEHEAEVLLELESDHDPTPEVVLMSLPVEANRDHFEHDPTACKTAESVFHNDVPAGQDSPGKGASSGDLESAPPYEDSKLPATAPPANKRGWLDAPSTTVQQQETFDDGMLDGGIEVRGSPPRDAVPPLSPRAVSAAAAEPTHERTRPKRRCTERSRKSPPVLPLKPPPPAAPRSRAAHGGERSVANDGGAGSGDGEGSREAAGADNANEQPPLVLCDAIMFDDDDEDDVSTFGKPSFRKTREQVVKVLLSGGMKKKLAARALAEEKAVAKGEKKEEDVSCMEISGGRFELFLGT